MREKMLFIAVAICIGFANISNAYINPSLTFVQNKGQFNSKVLAKTKAGNSGSLFIENNGITYLFFNQKVTNTHHHEKNLEIPKQYAHAFNMTFEGGNAQKVRWDDEQSYELNYFIGNDKSKWASGVKSYTKMVLSNMYQGVDVEYYRQDLDFKYDIIVQAGAAIEPIVLNYTGLDAMFIDKDGNFNMVTILGNLIEQKPYAYQILEDGTHKEVPVAFKLNNNKLSFNFPKGYNKKLKLVIDPVLLLSTFTGGIADNWGFSATYDRLGNAFGAGSAFGDVYPGLLGGYDNTFNGQLGSEDIFIVKFDPSGQNLLAFTYLGGTNWGTGTGPISSAAVRGNDLPMSIVCDAANNLYILGKTVAGDFPVTNSAYDRVYNGGLFDIVIVKLSSNCRNLLASTYIGGSGDDGHNAFTTNYFVNNNNNLNYNYGDYSRGEIIVDNLNNIYVACNTKSGNFPVTGGAMQSSKDRNQDGVVFKMNTNLSTLIWSTFLGGNSEDAAYGLVLDGGYGVYVTGGTESTNFSFSGFQRNFMGDKDGFLVHINDQGTAMINGTYVGTSASDQAYLVQKDNKGNVFVTGQTEGNFPVIAATFFSPNGKQFIRRYSPDLRTLQLSTNIGSGKTSGPDISITAFLVDVCNRIYICGWGGAVNTGGFNNKVGDTKGMPITFDAYQPATDGSDFYLGVLDEDAKSLIYGTYMGGPISEEHVDGGTSRFDPQGVVYHAVCAGCRGRSDFPTTATAFSRTNLSTNCNLAVFKFDFQLVNVVANFTTLPTVASGCAPLTIQFVNSSTFQPSYFWDFGNGDTSILKNPQYTFTKPGKYTVKLIVENCLKADTTERIITVFDQPVASIDSVPTICKGDSISLNANGGVSYSWFPNVTILAGLNSKNPLISSFSNNNYFVEVTDVNGCKDTASVKVDVFNYPLAFTLKDTTICVGEFATIRLKVDSSMVTSWQWETGNGILNPNDLNPVVNPKVPTTYYINGISIDGCKLRDSVLISTKFTVFASTLGRSILCEGETGITLSASGGISYLWNTGDTSRSIFATTTDTTLYWVIAYNGLCESKADTTILAINFIVPRFTLDPDTGVAPQLVKFNNLTTGANKFCWDFGDGSPIFCGTNPSHFYLEFGNYPVTLYATNTVTGCMDTLLFEFVVIDTVLLFIPNAITLNYDKLNDEFYVLSKYFKRFRFEIYNRWGELIFVSEDPKFTWKGTQNGRPVPSGTYVYKLTATAVNEVGYEKSGVIVVIK